MLIYSVNNLDVNAPYTYLTGQIDSGTNVIPWKNSAGASASWAVQIGKTGNSTSEIVLLGTAIPSGDYGTITGTTQFEHPTDTPIYHIKYDQVVFERSTTGTSGVASPIGTVNYQANGTTTFFDDTTGTPTYGYKTYFRNSVTGATTTESDWITSSGFSFASLGKLKQRAKDKIYDATYIPDDRMWTDWANEWLSEMNNAMVDVNEDYGIGTTQVIFSGTVEFGTITDTNFRGQTKRVWYQDGSGTYQARKMDSSSFTPTRIFNATVPYYYFVGDSVIGRKPSDTTGTFLIEYQKDQAVLANDTDEIPVPMHGYTKSFVDYMVSQAKKKDNKPDEGNELENRAYEQRRLFVTNISPRLRSQPTYVDVVESTLAEDGYWF